MFAFEILIQVKESVLTTLAQENEAASGGDHDQQGVCSATRSCRMRAARSRPRRAFCAGTERPAAPPGLPAERPEPLRRLLADLAQADDNLALQAMKRSEDGTAVIVRLCETDGRRGAVRMSTPVQPVDLLEDVQGEPVAELPYRPFEILSSRSRCKATGSGEPETGRRHGYHRPPCPWAGLRPPLSAAGVLLVAEHPNGVTIPAGLCGREGSRAEKQRV